MKSPKTIARWLVVAVVAVVIGIFWTSFYSDGMGTRLLATRALYFPLWTWRSGDYFVLFLNFGYMTVIVMMVMMSAICSRMLVAIDIVLAGC